MFVGSHSTKLPPLPLPAPLLSKLLKAYTQELEQPGIDQKMILYDLIDTNTSDAKARKSYPYKISPVMPGLFILLIVFQR